MQSNVNSAGHRSEPRGERAALPPERHLAWNALHEHLLAELSRVDLLIRARVARARSEGRKDDGFRGLYISDDDVDAALRSPPSYISDDGLGSALTTREYSLASADSSSLLNLQSLSCSARLRESRLRLLSDAFDLTAFDVNVLLLCLAPELDIRYERLFAYLQDDVTRRLPTVDLALVLLC